MTVTEKDILAIKHLLKRLPGVTPDMAYWYADRIIFAVTDMTSLARIVSCATGANTSVKSWTSCGRRCDDEQLRQHLRFEIDVYHRQDEDDPDEHPVLFICAIHLVWDLMRHDAIERTLAEELLNHWHGAMIDV